MEKLPHLLNKSGILGLNLLSFSGVMYSLINQLYCKSFSCVLAVWVWALLHALLHSSIDKSCCKSFFYALNLDSEESVELANIKLYTSDNVFIFNPRQTEPSSFAA